MNDKKTMTEEGREEEEYECGDEAQFMEAVRAVESGDESAKTKIAYYKLSRRDRFDPNEAIALLEERVKADDSKAMWMLGICYEYGVGIDKDTERAELLYRQSSETGNSTGRFLKLNGLENRGSGVMLLRL